MTPRRLRASGLSILAAAVLVLLPALAWLQYSWLDQIADADRDRRERTLQTAATQLAQDFDGELAKAANALQIESSIVEQQAWSRYAARYQSWIETAPAPQIVKAVYFSEHVEPRTATAGTGTEMSSTLRVWNPQTRTFDSTSWPPELEGMRVRFAAVERRIDSTNAARGARGRGEVSGRIERMLLPPSPVGSEQSIVIPIVRVTPAEAAGAPGDPPPPPLPPDVRVLGFTILQLDLSVLAHDVLPALVRKHLFDADGYSDYFVAVVARNDPSRVIFESEEGSAAAAASAPDTNVTLLSARPMFMVGRAAGRRMEERFMVNVFEGSRVPRAGQVRGEPLFAAPLEGHWRLVAKHRDGSLEAAVAKARARNFILSSGILALLAAAIGLIVVSARRADRLARQQLEFVAAVSHELRTPVSVIGAAAGNLADGVVEEPARVKKYGETIQSEARRLGETVERVLQLAGIAAGRGAAPRTPVSIADLIDSAVNACRGEIERSGATLEVDVDEIFRQGSRDDVAAPYLTADRGALSSALQNLIGNAIKYGGDRPWIRIEAVPAGRSAVRISVEDHGLGIPAEDRKHIFDPFYRGREAVARQIQGSGLGLHLVRRIVEAHGGTVAVQSHPQHGSTFTIELPTVRDTVHTLQSQESAATART